MLFSQTPCGDSSGNWNLELNNTYLTIIYTDSTLDSLTLTKQLQNNFRTLNGVKDFDNLNGTIVFNISGHNVDFERQGLKGFNTCVCLIHPMMYAVSIDVKDYKYRVTVSNVLTKLPQGSFGEINWNTFPFNRKGCLSGLNKGTMLTSFEILENDLTYFFTLKPNQKKSDW